MNSYLPGIDVLVSQHREWLAHARVGLIAHPASVNARGLPSAELLRQEAFNLACLMGPEHGFLGKGGAGEDIGHQRHPDWNIPVYSLYGDTRKPTPEMLADLDVIVFDLQDLGARPYTYVSTLRYVLEAAAENSKTVIVADRPIPLPHVVDGPMRQDAFESFVGFVRTPVVYGMTPGEAALWIRKDLGLDVEVRVAAMQHYDRNQDWPATGAWAPPSPAIRSLACARCFPVTVFFEALPSIDHARRSDQAFQCIGAPWVDGTEVSRCLNALALPGVRFSARRYEASGGEYAGQSLCGLHIEVHEAAVFKPVLTGITVLHVLQSLYGPERLWQAPGVREDFFDKLMGTDAVRRALQAGESPEALAGSWAASSRSFLEARQSVLLYS
ncbi:MAG TPA: hypothetical protein DCZ95_08605 [Verrucomicrobia bacterium]|nr:MAG: hypothetical protein A2X46_12640 [Lentisphaerae bacterium GWF2_57_35]HBA84139.1 hypothetical protein [Verrucomicrobiota bacterium]